MHRVPALFVASAAAALLAAAPASAQMGTGTGAQTPQAPQAPPVGTGGRAPGAWFGGGVGAIGQTLTGSIAVGGGRYRRTLLASGDVGGSTTDSSVGYVSGGLFYGIDAGRAGFSASYSGFGNYYAQLSDDVLVGHNASANARVQVTSRTDFSLSQAFYYAPPLARSLQGIFGGNPRSQLATEIDPGSIEDRQWTSNSDVGLSHRLTQRATLSATYGRRRSDYSGRDVVQVSDDAGVQYRHAIGSGLGFHAGYRHGTSRVENEVDREPVGRSGIDLGFHFARALSLTRSTTLDFGSGTTWAKSGDNERFLVNGQTNLTQMLGRSWSTGVGYSRRANFVEGVTEIVISDNADAFVVGQLSRRVSLSAQARASRGDIGLGDNPNSYTALVGSLGTSIAVAREVGLSLNYAYLRSEADSDEFLLTPSLQEYDGHQATASVGWRVLQFGLTYSTYRYQSVRSESLTASVSLFAPLIARTRRPDAAR